MEFHVNNNGKIRLIQEGKDKGIIVEQADASGNVTRRDYIEPGEMVMLINYLLYTRDNDIRNAFINPYGTEEPTADNF